MCHILCNYDNLIKHNREVYDMLFWSSFNLGQVIPKHSKYKDIACQLLRLWVYTGKSIGISFVCYGFAYLTGQINYHALIVWNRLITKVPKGQDCLYRVKHTQRVPYWFKSCNGKRKAIKFTHGSDLFWIQQRNQICFCVAVLQRRRAQIY